MAATALVPFLGLWLEAPESVLITRTEHRRNDPSDADARIVRMQMGQGTGQLGWRRIDASMSAASVLRSGLDRVQEHLPGAMNTAAAEEAA